VEEKKTNLISLADRTPEERRAIQSMGGKASAESRIKRKTFREEITEALSAVDDTDKSGRITQSVGIVALMARYKRGDLKAFELIRDTIGEKPTESMVLTANVNTPYDELTAEQLRELLKMHENGAI